MKKVLFVLTAIMALTACEEDKKDTAATDVVTTADTQPATDAVQSVDTAADVTVAADVTSVEQ